MSTFTPDPGTLFYADCQTYVTEGDTRVKARNFSTCILLCKAVDACNIVATVVHGGYGYGDEPWLLSRTDYVFSPVGPEVAHAVGLAEDGLPTFLMQANPEHRPTVKPLTTVARFESTQTAVDAAVAAERERLALFVENWMHRRDLTADDIRGA